MQDGQRPSKKSCIVREHLGEDWCRDMTDQIIFDLELQCSKEGRKAERNKNSLFRKTAAIHIIFIQPIAVKINKTIL